MGNLKNSDTGLRVKLLALGKQYGTSRVDRVWKSIAKAARRGAPKKKNLFSPKELAEFVDRTERGYAREIGYTREVDLKNVHQLAMRMVWQAEVAAGSKTSYTSFKSLVRKGRGLIKKPSEQK